MTVGQDWVTLQCPAINHQLTMALRQANVWSMSTQVPRATLRGVAELHVGYGGPQWGMVVTSCYF